MFKYVQLDNSGNVIGTLDTPKPAVESANLILVDENNDKIGKRFENGLFVDNPQVVNFGTKISRVAFLKRFTDAEWVIIDELLQYDRAATPDNRIKRSLFRRDKDILFSQPSVNLASQDTINRVNSLFTRIAEVDNNIDPVSRSSSVLDIFTITEEELP